MQNLLPGLGRFLVGDIGIKAMLRGSGWFKHT